MSTAMWKLEKDLCRCCHAEGSFKNLSEPCFQLGQEEIYSDMLQECLDVKIVPMMGSLQEITFTICESCVVRLRDATNFKKQVLDCEERFKDMYSRNLIRGFEVKDEPLISDTEDINMKEELQSGDDEEDDTFLNFDDDDLPSDQSEPADVERKTRSKGKTKNKPKAKAKPEKKTKAKKPKDDETELTEAAVSGEKKKGGTAPRAPKFYLRDGDFKKEGDAYLCTRCDKRYYKVFSLRFHVKTKHYKIPRFICQYCPKEFMTLAPLTVHKLEEHNIDDRFKCNACKGTFNTKVQLRKHINNFHMLGEKYKCDFCEYESFSFESLYKHKFKHRTVKDYHCKFCRKSFLRKTTLDLHERIHTGDRRKVCSVCGQAFVQKASLNYHMTKYHPEVNF